MRRLVLCAALLLPGTAFAVPPLYLPDSLAGVRSIGMGDAFRGVGTSNDAIVENPAAMALTPHYEIAGFFGWDTQAPAAYWNGSIVDANTLPVAVGLSYTHIGSGTDNAFAPNIGRYVGASYRLALAIPVSDIVYIGAGVHWLDYGGDVPTDAVTGDAALMLKLTDQLSIGAIGYNLIGIDSVLAPRRVALGTSFGTDTTFRLDVDVVATLANQSSFDVHGGGELFLFQILAVRAGYFYSGLVEQSFGSVGLGLIIPGFALDAAFRQQVAPWDDHLFMLDLKFFLSG